MYIKNMIHDKKKRKNLGNWDKNIIIAWITKHSYNYRLDECHFMKFRNERLKAYLAYPNFFTFYTAVKFKGCLFSTLSLKCASNEHQDTLGIHFPPSDLGCRGTT